MLPEGLQFLELGWWVIHVLAVLLVWSYAYRKGRRDERRARRERETGARAGEGAAGERAASEGAAGARAAGARGAAGEDAAGEGAAGGSSGEPGPKRPESRESR